MLARVCKFMQCSVLWLSDLPCNALQQITNHDGIHASACLMRDLDILRCIIIWWFCAFLSACIFQIDRRVHTLSTLCTRTQPGNHTFLRHALLLSYTQACAQTHRHSNRPACMHADMQAFMHTRMLTTAHPSIHVYMHTHTVSQPFIHI